jgi:hypothetical protein
MSLKRSRLNGNVLFIYGRMNPPTKGHVAIIKNMIRQAQGKPAYVFVSHTQGPKDPIPRNLKLNILKQALPANKYPTLTIMATEPKPGKIVTVANIKKFLTENQGFSHPHFLLGSNRINKGNFRFLNSPTFTRRQIGEKRVTKNLSPRTMKSRVNSGNLNVISGTLARYRAKHNTFNEFKKVMPNGVNNATLRKVISYV